MSANSHVIIRTKMSEALLTAVKERSIKGHMNKAERQLSRHVLTQAARGVGVKFNSALTKKKIKAETAVDMREAA
jgi:hypothetical protein